MNESIVEFFRRGQHGDLLIFKQYGGWESIFTMAPHDPDNAPRIADQFRTMDADHLIYAERVRLQSNEDGLEDVAVVTDLPNMNQSVIVIATGEEKKVRAPIRTETLTAINSAIQSIIATAAK